MVPEIPLTLYVFQFNRLMKSKLQEINCSLIISRTMNGKIFEQLEMLLNHFNQMWKKQEEIKRARAIEEASLYVNKYVKHYSKHFRNNILI